MKLTFILTLLAASITAAPIATPAQQTPTPHTTIPNDLDPSGMDLIFIQEMRMWQALQAHDLVTLQSLLLPDFIEVEKNIWTRDQTLANLNACTLVTFNLHNHQVRVLSPDIAVIAYTGSNELTCGQTHLTGSYNATTTWVRRDGKWLVQIHTEIPIRPQPKNP
jgi:hypothetical protein